MARARPRVPLRKGTLFTTADAAFEIGIGCCASFDFSSDWLKEEKGKKKAREGNEQYVIDEEASIIEPFLLLV